MYDMSPNIWPVSVTEKNKDLSKKQGKVLDSNFESASLFLPYVFEVHEYPKKHKEWLSTTCSAAL